MGGIWLFVCIPATGSGNIPWTLDPLGGSQDENTHYVMLVVLLIAPPHCLAGTKNGLSRPFYIQTPSSSSDSSTSPHHALALP